MAKARRGKTISSWGQATHNPHLSQHDLERYHLGMVKDEAELAPLEEHFLACYHCARRAEEIADYVNAMRAAAKILVDETAPHK